MYSSKHAEKISNDELKVHTVQCGYYSVRSKARLWNHNDNNTIFTLVMDNFFVQYISEAKVEKFLQALRSKYKITLDRKFQKYIGLSLK